MLLRDVYSPLDQINKFNVKKLGFAWSYNIVSSSRFEATPIVVDGVMFTSGNKGVVYALDARTGVERWVFDPHIDLGAMRLACCGPVNRGVAVWRGRVYMGSLQAATKTWDPNSLWEVGGGGTAWDSMAYDPYTSTGPVMWILEQDVPSKLARETMRMARSSFSLRRTAATIGTPWLTTPKPAWCTSQPLKWPDDFVILCDVSHAG